MSKCTFQWPMLVWLVSSTLWAATDPFVGKWKLNPSKSQLTDVMKVEVAGPNKYALIFAPGYVETVVADGTDQPGNFGTTLSITVEGPDSWKIVRKKAGRTIITGLWKLSEDGTMLHDNFTAHRPDGSKFNLQYVYKRTAGRSGFPGTWESVSEKVGADSVFEIQIQPYEGDGLSFIQPSQKSTKNIKFDGKDYPNLGPNVPSGSVSSGRRVDRLNLEMTDKIEGKVTDTQQIKLSPDLKVMTMTVHQVGQSKPNILAFDRE